MATKKILITGIGATATERGIRSLLDRFGPVEKMDIIREGSQEEPVALVEMDIGDGAAAYLLSRLTQYWHDGCLLSACLLMH